MYKPYFSFLSPSIIVSVSFWTLLLFNLPLFTYRPVYPESGPRRYLRTCLNRFGKWVRLDARRSRRFNQPILVKTLYHFTREVGKTLRNKGQKDFSESG